MRFFSRSAVVGVLSIIGACAGFGIDAHAQKSVWLGTAPACSAQPADCTARGMEYVRSDKYGDGAVCWSGTKVLCREKEPVPPGSVWMGTAPFCAAKPTDCSDNGMIYVRSDAHGDGAKCSSGAKVLCKPDPHPAPARTSVWIGTAPFCAASENDCARYGLEYQTPPPQSAKALYEAFYKDYGNHCTNGGKKVRCAIPAPPEAAVLDSANAFNVVSFNIYAKPYILGNTGQVERICRIPAALATYASAQRIRIDAIAFQEAFITDCVGDLDLYKLLKEYGWPHVAKVRPAAGGSIGNGGTFIASRWPILEEDNIIYRDCEGWDCHAAKSARYARIVKSVGGQTATYHLFGTHLNAYNSDSQTGAEVRRKQAQQLKDAITELDIPASEAVIIAGDLNVNLNGDFKLQRTDREPYKTMQLLEAKMPQVVFGTDGLQRMEGTHSGGDLSELNTATRAWLDYTLTSTAHLAPDTATMQAIPLTVVFPRMRLLSDHLPVLGKFVFPLAGA